MDITITITSNKSKEITIEYLKKKLLDDLVSNIGYRLERHFEFYVRGKENNTFLISDHFVTPPAKGELYFYNDKHYRVLEVIHYYFGKQTSSILVEETIL